MKKEQTTETTATTEFVNRYGLTAFQYGEKISSTNTGKIYLTATNCAISIVRIHREHTTNLTISAFMDDIDSMLKYAWNNIDKNGKIHGLDRIKKEYAEDAISECVTTLLQYAGQKYSQEIQKAVRNAYGRTLDNMQRDGDSIQATELTERIPYKPVYTDNSIFHNSNLIDAIKKCGFSDEDFDIIVRIANGETQTAIADDMQLSKMAISKRYKKALEKLRVIMVH